MRSSPDTGEAISRPSSRIPIDGHEVIRLAAGWTAAAAPPDTYPSPAGLDSLSWLPARVPGTAASALADAGLWRAGDPHDFAAEDWWFRTSFTAAPATSGEEVVLRLDGIATVAEVHLNGELLLTCESMFAAHSLDVGTRLLATGNELAIRCRALEPLLRKPRRPRARWRTRLVSDGNLRFFRTMLLGWAPGIAPSPATVGPWRGVSIERRRRLAVEELALRPRVSGEEGRLAVRARLRALGRAPITTVELELSGPSGTFLTALALARDGDAVRADGELTAPAAARWWPHTHGEPILHRARLLVRCGRETTAIDAGRVGFRELAFGTNAAHDVELEGLDLHVNGVRIFARGAVWTPVDAVGLAPSDTELRAALEQARNAGMNMLRLPGTGAYETSAFHDMCDELGILVWQDFMFANLDYPILDDAFRDTVTREVDQELDRIAGRPSLVVLCGNSEIEQQVAMLGLDPALGRGELFGELLPELVRQSGADAVYLPSAPCGGDRPFRPDSGVANYYGVGGYRRPLEDVRRAAVRFAAECLAFSNVPEETAIEEMLPGATSRLVVHHPRWKAGVPRDAGSGWDFEDVRDHYLALLFDVDPGELRRTDHERYLELSRAVTGEVMGEVFGEWRRAASPCGGGLVLWLRDLAPGAGWGVVDHRGRPKAAYHHLRRALAPVACWMTDEGLAGIAVHVANDRPHALTCHLRLALYRDFEDRVREARKIVELAPHSVGEWNVETLLGHFVDASWAYRFGPPQQNLIVASLERDDGAGGREGASEPISQSVRFPAGRPLLREPNGRLHIAASAEALADGSLGVRIRAKRFAQAVSLHVPGFRPTDDAFQLEPGRERLVRLRPDRPGASFAGGHLTALNIAGRVRIEELQADAESATPASEDKR